MRYPQRTDTVSEFHVEAPQATVSEELAQGPYVAVRVGVEPMTLWTKGVDSTNGPPRPTIPPIQMHSCHSIIFQCQQRLINAVAAFSRNLKSFS